jgi:hypothetical protein
VKKSLLFLALAGWLVRPALSASLDTDEDPAPAAKPQARSHFVQDSGSSGASISPLDAGDAPTAYTAGRYELRADARFYRAGGILTKGYLGIFPWLTLGGAADVRGAIGNSQLNSDSADAKGLVKVRLLEEGSLFNGPGFALGWDGLAYDGGRPRGFYLAASKEVRVLSTYLQVHGGLNTAASLQGLDMRRDVTGWAATTTTLSQMTFFGELDDIARDGGPSFNAGGRYSFDPLQIGIEFRGMGRGEFPSRMVRISYDGQF